ncbi:DUF4055 domain-containing protein [Brachymonas wangyanguii]|uniref:DUF4055 domain-containing protein n=1 Tax=Brachymonas wangyanguii TaxID=3130163 RepID=UPI00307DE5B7
MNPDTQLPPFARIAPEVQAQTEHWPLIDALLAGSAGMRAAGQRYLPKRRLESPEDYAVRLQTATLYPAFSETVQAMVGRVFTKSFQYGNNIPKPLLEEVIPDIDRERRNLQEFARLWFEDALCYGLSFALVLAPEHAANVGGHATRSEERQAGLRPYVKLIRHDQVIGWQSEVEAGVERLIQVRIRETVNAPEGEFGMAWRTRIWVLEPGRARSYTQTSASSAAETWELREWPMVAGAKQLTEIPLVPLYTRRTGFMQAQPPLLELAQLNAKHWWLQSALDKLLDTASVPILVLTGVDEGEVLIGANTAVHLPAGGEARYVEHSGAAIEAGRQALLDLEETIRQAGAKLLQRADATQTAAQAREEAAKEISRLGVMSQSLEDALDIVLFWLARWMGLGEEGGSVALHPNLDPDFAPTETMQLLLQMASSGKLSDATLFSEAQRRGLLSDDLDWEQEQARIGRQPDGELG